MSTEAKLLIGILYIVVAVLLGVISIFVAKQFFTTKEIMGFIFPLWWTAIIALAIFGWKYAFS